MNSEISLNVIFGRNGFDQIPNHWRDLKAQLGDQAGFDKVLKQHTVEPYEYSLMERWTYLPKQARWVRLQALAEGSTVWIMWVPGTQSGVISDRRLKRVFDQVVQTAKRVGATSVTLNFPFCPPTRRRKNWKKSMIGKRMRLIFRWWRRTERKTGILMSGVSFPGWRAKS